MVRSLQRLAIHGYKNFQMIFFQKLISLKWHIPTSIDGQQVKVTNGYLNFQFSQKPLFSEDKLDKKNWVILLHGEKYGSLDGKVKLILKGKRLEANAQTNPFLAPNGTSKNYLRNKVKRSSVAYTTIYFGCSFIQQKLLHTR